VSLRLRETPPSSLARLEGVVRHPSDQPFASANVDLAFPFATGVGGAPSMSLVTGLDGKYAFDGLSVAEHVVTAWAPGHARHHKEFVPPAGGTQTEDLKLYPSRTIVLNYVYQPDGTRRFDRGEVRSGTLLWTAGNGGLDFSKGAVVDSQGRDLELEQNQNALSFRCFYGDGRNGFYDAGAVALDTVTEAAESGYSMTALPCQVGHVYVVRTYGDHHYAKLIVTAD
jgi:hypothetical protein